MITRFASLFNPAATTDPIGWGELFDEFSIPRAHRGDDQPGWSAATFDPPARSLANVRTVGAVVLDYDNKTRGGERAAAPVTVDAAEETWRSSFGLLHTTRNHTAEWPRFRVILPLSRPVSPFEYAALWQRIAAHVERTGPLDPSPKDASRFWYTPGVGDVPGACFEARRLVGALLDPDEWLARPLPGPSLPSATDSSPGGGGGGATVTPINQNTKEMRARAYVERMPEAVAGQSGHDALWKVARKLVADFELDQSSAFRIIWSEYNPRCRPPWSERDVRHKLADAERSNVRNPVPDRPHRRVSPAASGQTAAATAPVVEPPEAGPNSSNWQQFLKKKSNGDLTRDPANATLILRFHDDWAGCLEYDEFADIISWGRRSPVDAVGFTPPEEGARLQDHDYIPVHHWLAKTFDVSFSKQTIFDALISSGMEASVHPLRAYLSGLTWDGTPRLSTWLQRYLGAAPSEYTSAVGRWWLISAVARAFQPGCQADHMLILEGAQGAGKSSAMKALGGRWYLGTLPDIRDRDRAAAVLQGNWIVEIGELDAFRGAAATRVKDFLTQSFDEYRAAYARLKMRRVRACVFVGTTNEGQYLQDSTGARRFWPVRIGAVDTAALTEQRDQLLAEAVLAYQAGEPWWPTGQYGPEIEEEQQQRYDEDEWSVRIGNWLEAGQRNGVTVADVLAGPLDLRPVDWDRSAQIRAGICLRRLGLAPHQVVEHSVRVRRYYRHRLDEPPLLKPTSGPS